MLTDRTLARLSSERCHPAADSDRCRYPQASSTRSLGTLMEEQEKRLWPQGNGNSTGSPADSTNLDPWGSPRLNYQPKNIHRLDLDLPAHIQQMCSLVFLWVLNNRTWGCPKRFCLTVGCVLLAELSSLSGRRCF